MSNEQQPFGVRRLGGPMRAIGTSRHMWDTEAAIKFQTQPSAAALAALGADPDRHAETLAAKLERLGKALSQFQPDELRALLRSLKSLAVEILAAVRKRLAERLAEAKQPTPTSEESGVRLVALEERIDQVDYGAAFAELDGVPVEDWPAAFEAAVARHTTPVRHFRASIDPPALPTDP